jgi:23S rRNA pseudouridine955/2504/2580 synthase
LKFYPGNNGGHTLVEFSPKTGRTHQIRIHAKHIGHAIVADEFYAGRKTARNDRKWCPRLFLHAASIKFTHPATNNSVEFESDLPGDLERSLSLLN